MRQSAQEVDDFNGTLEELVSEMHDTMYEKDGIGLAAPQVGKPIQLFVCQVQGDEFRVFVNPEIIETSPEQVYYEEGCLSIPGVFAEILRSKYIKVQAKNLKGRYFTLEADGLLSRVIQHEMDHLKGTLFVDHLDEKKRNRVEKQYQQNGSK